MKKIFLYVVFVIIVVGDLVGEYLQSPQIDYIFKPLIMIWIASFFAIHSKHINKKIVKLTLFAFLFSWLGDILLMFANEKFSFFVLGLVSFLIAQLFYINLFLNTIVLSGERPFLKKHSIYLVFYIIYGLAVYTLLYNSLNGVLKLAVFVYMLALLSMSAMALNRYGNGHRISFQYVFTGSLLFVFSDTLIAINRFLVPIPFEGMLIMATYISAQFLIMRGLLKQYEE